MEISDSSVLLKIEGNNQMCCYHWQNNCFYHCFLCLNDRPHLRAEMECRVQDSPLPKLRWARAGWRKSMGEHSTPGSPWKEWGNQCQMEKPQAKSKRATLLGTQARRQGYSLCVGTGPLPPAYRQWLPCLLCLILATVSCLHSSG